MIMARAGQAGCRLRAVVRNQPLVGSPQMIDPESPTTDEIPPETTGRYVVVFSNAAIESDAVGAALHSVAGISSIAFSRDFKDQAIDFDQTESAEAIVLSELGIAVVEADPVQVSALQQ